MPILAVLGSFEEKGIIIKGLGELRVKESDRLTAIQELLSKAGRSVQVTGRDDLIVTGQNSSLNQACEGFEFDSRGDHRMAMAAIILATKAKAPSHIKGVDCIDVSYPNFFPSIAQIGAD